MRGRQENDAGKWNAMAPHPLLSFTPHLIIYYCRIKTHFY